jgi:hypothetical protein
MSRVSFEKTTDVALRFSKKLGRCIGWGCFSKKAGVEYDDLHGDHFPDDELFAAVGGLMKTDYAKREIDIEHLGAAQGSIVTAWAMTEDVAKSLNCDTGGNYGILVDLEPSAELLKSIEAGEMFSLSMFGTAVAEPVAKTAGEVDVEKKRKRVMRDVKLTKWAVCKSPAHEGAGVTLVKSAPSDEAIEAVMKAAPRKAFVHIQVAKRTPCMTTAHDGHQHLIADAEEKDGFTSWETAASDQYGHSHPWVRGASGTIVIGEANGHSHEIEETTMPTDIEKAQTDLANLRAELAKSNALVAKALALPDDQKAYAKRLAPGDVATFLGLSDADRAALAKPIHKSERTGRSFYAGEESLAEMAKDADAMAEKLAKSEQAAEAVTFEKRAEEVIKHWPGTLAERAAIMKAVDGIADEALRNAAIEKCKAADVAFASITKRVGHSGGGDLVGATGAGPEAQLNALATEIQKAAGGEAAMSFAKAYDQALSTPKGAQLYAELDAASRAQPSN